MVKLGAFLRPFCFDMKIKNKLHTTCKTIEPLYFVEIQEGSTIAYITKTEIYQYPSITTQYNESWLFDDPNKIHNLDILKGLNYNIINFNDIFVPYYIIRITDNNTIEQQIKWTTIGTPDINQATRIATTNLQTAKEKLNYLKYLTVHELQQKICDICEIEICVPTVGN